MLKFNNPEVEAEFESNQGDITVHLPGGRTVGAGWKGKLADIPIEQARRWVDRPGQNLLKRKTTITPAANSGQAEEEN